MSRTVKKIIGWVVALLVALGIAIGVWRWREKNAAPEITYRSAAAEKKRIIAKVTASGTLQATVTVQIGAQVSGRISKLNADYNSTVKKGELIAKLDPQLFIAAMEREKANTAAARAGVTRAEAQQRDADLVLKRAKSLHEQGLASAAELQTAETAVSVAAAATEVAKATLQQQQAALNQAQVNLSYTDIFSPIDGTVISRSVDVGQTVAASLQAPVLFTIAEDLKKMQVHTSVAEGDVGRLQPGMDTWFTVDAFPGQRFKGKISQIRNAAQTVQNVVTYDAVIDVQNDDLRLRPGMTATTTIVFAEKHDVLAIPNTALRFKPPSEVASAIASASAATPAASLSVTAAGGDPAAMASASAAPAPAAAASGGGPPRKRRWGGGAESTPERQIYVLRNGKPEQVEVKIGLTDGTVTEITSGELKEGDQVITEANVAGKTPSAGSGPPPRMGRMF
jgi:HlyD family secretion protein